TQVDPWPGCRSAAGRACRGNRRDHGPCDPGRRRHRPRPRRPRQRPRGAYGGRHRQATAVSDRIVLANMRFDGRHGDHDWERAQPQPFEVDVELSLDLRAAGASDDLRTTVDYGRVFDLVREIVETRTFHLLEAIAQAIADDVL